MPTERLYYQDSRLRSFEAQVLSCVEAEGRFHVILDRTAFYPLGGGQPYDVGTLSDVNVIDVFEQEETGEVVHVTKTEVGGGRVYGLVDWVRRLDHMQQHSGQHILSAAFIHSCQAPTVGFHLGLETSTIDLQTARSIPDQLEDAVRLANQVVFEDREVRVLNVTREQAEGLSLRKESDREGILRVIEVSDFDRSPCGGTHVTRTGQVGLIATRKVERYKQGWRVEFVCGGRAGREAQKDFQCLTQASKLLSSPFEQIPSLIEKQIEESKAARRERSRILDELAAFRARALTTEARAVGARRLLTHIFHDEDPEFVKMLAHHAIEASGVVVAFILAGEQPQVVIAAAPDSGVEAGQWFKACAAQFSMKGGGSRTMAQGSLASISDAPGLFQFLENLCVG